MEDGGLSRQSWITIPQNTTAVFVTPQRGTFFCENQWCCMIKEYSEEYYGAITELGANIVYKQVSNLLSTQV